MLRYLDVKFLCFTVQNGSSASLELDLEHYVVPAPSTSANSGLVYAANLAENPRSLTSSGVSGDRPATIKVYLGNPSCKCVS